MLRLTRQTDYGIVLMTHLASIGHGQTANARELSASTHLPLPMVSKILKVLAREHLLVSQRGVKGGYGLARRPEEITVGALISALDGEIAMTDCIPEATGNCEHETVCRLRSNWLRINNAVRTALESLSLADMAIPDCDEDHLLTLKSISNAGEAETASGSNVETA